MRGITKLAFAVALPACGGQPAPSAATANTAPTSESAAAANADAKPAGSGEPAADDDAAAKGATKPALTRDIPTECVPGSNPCVAPRAFVEKLCRGKYPDLALVLFGKAMPWQHAYLKVEYLEPVNPYGGEQDEHWLKFGEEVLVLGKHGGDGKGAAQVSGPTDVDVLRWDGVCATIRQEMLASYVTAPMDSPRIAWRYLSSETQEALNKDPLVAKRSAAEKSVCKGSSVMHPEEKCDKVLKSLTDAIVAAVHRGIELPTPAKLPEWAK